MQVIYGTTNQAKLDSMKRIAKALELEITGLEELNQPIPIINETGKNPLENAKLKAEAYYKSFAMPVFSCDSGLYFDDLKEEEQPETHIRRVNGKELSDEEMIEYYSALAGRHNHQLIGRYRNAICFIYDDEHTFMSMDKSLETEAFLLVSVPHEKRVKGFPIDSLSVDIHSGKYYYDLENQTVDQSAVEKGFQNFFQKCLSEINESK